MKHLFAYAELPRTGLGNMLFPWARASLFARAHHCPMLAPNWVKVNRIGPLIRFERDKRYYFGQFTNKGYIGGLQKLFILLRHKSFSESEYSALSEGVCTFSGMGNYFKDISGAGDILLNELYRIANIRVVDELMKLPKRFIGVHIRRGDFVVGGLAIGGDYYIRAIEKAVDVIGDESVPILIFSDARKTELEYLMHIKGVEIMPSKSALHDLLALAKSDVLVGTNNSTFSGWAAFLGRMKSIWAKDEKPHDDTLGGIFI